MLDVVLVVAACGVSSSSMWCCWVGCGLSCVSLCVVVRAVDSQCMSDRHETCEEMFRLPPISLLRTFPSEEEGSGEGSPSSADPDTESELGDGEEDSLPAPLENSGLSAAGANLLYLSDQVGGAGVGGWG